MKHKIHNHLLQQNKLNLKALEYLRRLNCWGILKNAEKYTKTLAPPKTLAPGKKYIFLKRSFIVCFLIKTNVYTNLLLPLFYRSLIYRWNTLISLSAPPVGGILGLVRIPIPNPYPYLLQHMKSQHFIFFIGTYFFKGAQVREFLSHGFFLFLHHKASMGRQLQGKNQKLKILIFKGSFWGFFFENFVLEQAECAQKNFFFQSRAKVLRVYVYFWTHLHATRRMLKNFTLSGFLGFFKNIEIFGFLAHTPRQRRQFFSACSACVGNFLAQAQPA